MANKYICKQMYIICGTHLYVECQHYHIKDVWQSVQQLIYMNSLFFIKAENTQLTCYIRF